MSQSDTGQTCHFFLQGACRNGASCRFSHNAPPAATPGLICKFYQAGMCAYGDKCRYDHVKSTPPSTAATAATAAARGAAPPAGTSILLPRSVPKPAVDAMAEADALTDRLQNIRLTAERQESVLQGMNGDGGPFAPSTSGRASWMPVPIGGGGAYDPLSLEVEDLMGAWMPTLAPALPAREKPLCLHFLVNGCCPDGDECRRVHGAQCPICLRHCLHPFRKEEHEEHIKECGERQAMTEARQWSSQFECGICLEPVLSIEKPGAKFGLLNCGHTFCLDCIRQWRKKFGEGLDVESALRACPICRQVSYFIVPSPIWPRSDDEKHEIIESYKSKLKTIDCRHYDQGRGTCPFGTSCFYRHTDEQGNEEVPSLRKIGNSDGEITVLSSVKLADFLLAAPSGQRLLRNGRRR